MNMVSTPHGGLATSGFFRFLMGDLSFQLHTVD